jgi:hypothetical protein
VVIDSAQRRPSGGERRSPHAYLRAEAVTFVFKEEPSMPVRSRSASVRRSEQSERQRITGACTVGFAHMAFEDGAVKGGRS